MKKKLICFILLIAGLVPLASYGQGSVNRNLEIAGVVTDDTGTPLPGVSIFVKNATGVGTTTDIDGKFRLRVALKETVVFQMVGMTNVELIVDKSVDDLEIVMSDDAQQLEEVVITGLSSQKKISVVGAITTVDLDQLKTPAVSLNNMLGGRVAGVMSLTLSGEPGKNISNFWIRGIGTFGANSGALVLIDGLEGRLQDVDPDDVQSFQILKDAAATAVYGARGANGVVIVTTKRGTSGKLQITGRATMQINQLRRLPEYLGAYDYAKLANEARAMSGDPDLYTRLDLDVIRSGLDPEMYPDVNWIDEIMKKTSMQQRYYVSARGGGEKATYFLSIGAQQEYAAYKQDDSKFKKPLAYNKLTYRANIDMNLTPLTKLYFGLDGNMTTHTLPGMQNTDMLWQQVRRLTPVMFPVRYSDGTLPTYGTTDDFSPYTSLNYSGYTRDNPSRNMITLSLSQQVKGIFEGLTLSAQVSSDYENYFYEYRRVMPDMYRATGRDAQGNLIKSRRRNEEALTYFHFSDMRRRYFGEGKANWSRTFDRHDLGALLYFYMEDISDSRWSTGNMGINAIPERKQNSSAQLRYGYNNTYFLDTSFGYSGSSQFKKGQRFGLFPSVAVGWVPTSYVWVQENIPVLSFLKIRGSYGAVGNDAISGSTRFPYLTLINNRAGSFWDYRGQGIVETQQGADNLKWEVEKKANLGIEAKFFEDKLSFTVDIFNNQRDNIFMPRVTLPEYLGLVTTPQSNVGSMHTYGSDGNVSYTHKISSDMDFTVRANYSFAQDIIDYYEENKLPYDYMSVTGKPFGIIRGYISEGLFKDREEIETSPDQSAFGRVRPGDIKYRDVNGDGIINEDDKVPLSYGNQVPRFQYGMGADFRYKKFTFAFLFNGAAKAEYYRAGLGNDDGWIPFYRGDLGNVIKVANNPANRWTPAWYSGTTATENPNAEFPRLSYGGNTNNSQLSTFWKRDGSYIRLQEVSLRYKLDKEAWIRILGLQSIDLEFVTNNIFTIDKVKYFDPQQATFNGGAYPIPTSYTLQLYLNF